MKRKEKKNVTISVKKSDAVNIQSVPSAFSLPSQREDISEIKRLLANIARNYGVLGKPLTEAVSEAGVSWEDFARWRNRFHRFWKTAIEDAVEDDIRDTMRAVALRRNRIIDRLLESCADELIPETFLEIVRSDAPSFIRMRAAKELAAYMGINAVVQRGVIDGRDAIASGRTSQLDPRSVEILHKSIGVVEKSAETMRAIAQASLESASRRAFSAPEVEVTEVVEEDE